MKEFSMTEINTIKRREILNLAKKEGVILNRKNTNGKTIDSFVIVSKGCFDAMVTSNKDFK